MPKARGRRDPDYDAKRAQLLEAIADALTGAPHAGLSFRALADAAGVATPTLKHYFQDRDGVITAVLPVLASRISIAEPSEPVSAEGWIAATARAEPNRSVFLAALRETLEAPAYGSQVEAVIFTPLVEQISALNPEMPPRLVRAMLGDALLATMTGVQMSPVTFSTPAHPGANKPPDDPVPDRDSQDKTATNGGSVSLLIEERADSADPSRLPPRLR